MDLTFSSPSRTTAMFFLRIFLLVGAWRVARTERSHSHQRITNVGPPSFRRTPTLVECRDGSSRPLINASSSSSDVSSLRTHHPHCPFSVLEFRETLPHCPDISFCPREFRAISPCGDCCYVCREPNEYYMAENAAAVSVGMNNSLHQSKESPPGPCINIKCKRYQKCVLNIQGLPVCRCFPVEMCNTHASGLPAAIGGRKKKEKKLEKEICGSDGISYETKCHMQVAACQSKSHIRTAHKGACMKPAQTPRRSEPSIKIKPSRGNRKQKQSSRRFLASIMTTVPPAIQSVIAAGGMQPSHPQPAIIVPIISPSSSLQGNRGRKQQGASHRGRSSSSSIPDSPSSFNNRDRIIVPVGEKGINGRKSGRREKPPRSERPRGDRTRHERPGRIRDKSGLKNDRTDRARTRVPEQQSERGRVEQVVVGRFERPERARFDRPERTRLDKTIRFKSPRTERPRAGRPEKPKGSKKIQRLERKKQKLEKRLMKEKEKVRRKQS